MKLTNSELTAILGILVMGTSIGWCEKTKTEIRYDETSENLSDQDSSIRVASRFARVAKIQPVFDILRKSFVFRTDDEIKETLNQHSPGINHLFRKYLDTGIKDGLIYFEIEIDQSGSIDQARILRSTTSNEAFDNDLLRRLKMWRFSEIKGQAKEIVWFPLVLINYQKL